MGPLEQMSENEKVDHFKTNRMLPAHSSVAHPDRRIITREALSDARMNTFTGDGQLARAGCFIDEYESYPNKSQAKRSS
jgi:hypothetical protein